MKWTLFFGDAFIEYHSEHGNVIEQAARDGLSLQLCQRKHDLEQGIENWFWSLGERV